jgi:Flp pilus assembly protein TadG
MTHAPSRFRACRSSRFASHEEGATAVEFALVLPVLLFLFVGVTQVGEAVSISRKVTVTTRTITDLVTQNTSLSASSLNTYLAAAAQVIAPYSSSNLSITVSEIQIDSSGKATVAWSGSWPNSANALTTGATFAIPSALDTPSTYIIYGRATYNYTPVWGYNVIGPITLSDQLYLNPRDSTSIAYTN